MDPTEPPWRAWHTQTVRSQLGLSEHTTFDEDQSAPGDVEIGPEDHQHFAYARGPPGEIVNIVYAEPTDVGWEHERIVHGALPDDLALDGDDDPWIAWMDDAQSRLETRNASDSDWWTIEFADDGRDLAIEVDGQGRVHVAMADTGGGPDVVEHGVFDPTQPGRPVHAVKSGVQDPACPLGEDPRPLRADAQNPCSEWHAQAVDHDGTGSAVDGPAWRWTRRACRPWLTRTAGGSTSGTGSSFRTRATISAWLNRCSAWRWMRWAADPTGSVPSFPPVPRSPLSCPLLLCSSASPLLCVFPTDRNRPTPRPPLSPPHREHTPPLARWCPAG